MTIDEIRGHLAGELARHRAAHPIRHHEQRSTRPDLVFPDFGHQARVAGAQIGDEEGVFIMVPGAPTIGLSEDGGENGSHSGDPFQCSGRQGESVTNLESASMSVNVVLA